MPEFKKIQIKTKTYYKYKKKFYIKYSNNKARLNFSDICLKYGKKDFMEIYNDSANEEFRKKLKTSIPLKYLKQYVSKYIPGETTAIYLPVNQLEKQSINKYIKKQCKKEEVIIIAGTERHYNGYGEKLMFPAQAVREIRETYSKTEYVTILMFKDGYNREEVDAAKKATLYYNVNTQFITINSRQEMINYINTKTIDKSENIRNSRIDDDSAIVIIKIKKIIFFTHGYPSRLTFNLVGNTSDPVYEFNKKHISQLEATVFTSGAAIYSYACRTGNMGSVIDGTDYTDDKEWKKKIKPEESLAQKLADHLNIPVYAFIVRTNYTPTWHDHGDKKFQSSYKDIKDKSVDRKFFSPKTWNDKPDVALWNPKGAYSKPIGGETPKGLPRKMFKFTKGEPFK
jgi:hypothetical protein